MVKWKEEYIRELEKAKRRAKLVEERTDWIFELPQSMPHDAAQAAKRITELKKVSIKNIESREFSRYARYSERVPSPGPPIPGYRAYPLTPSQFRDLRYAQSQYSDAQKKAGSKVTEKKATFRHKEGYKAFIKKYGTKRKATAQVKRKQEILYQNTLQSLTAMRLRYDEILGADENADLIDIIIDAYSKLSIADGANLTEAIISWGGTIGVDILGSEYNTLSLPNLERIARILGIDLAKFKEDRKQEKAKAELRKDF